MISSLDIDRLFENFTHQKILIIGDVMIDKYLWGKVRRVSPEAPVPVISEVVEEKRLGGAANVALNIKAMGAVPILCSVIGKDRYGKTFLELLRDENLSDIGIVMDKSRITTQKTRIISDKHHLLRVDEEMEDEITEEVEKKMLDFALELIRKKSVNSVLFQDYDKGVITKNLIDKIITTARKAKIPVLVDPKRKNFLNYRKVSLFKPNFKELRDGLKSDIDLYDLEAVAGLVEEFRKMNEQDVIMVTLSEMGIIVNHDSAYHHIAAEVRDITDVSGAGDTVISMAALCLGEKLSALETAILANLAGGQVCEKSGVVPVNREQLLEEAKLLREEISE